VNRLSWTFVSVTLAILLITGIFYLWPTISNTWQIYQKEKKAKIDLSDAAKKKDILDNLSKNDKLKNVYSIAANYIPENQDSGDLVIELTAIAGQSNLKVTQFSLDSAVVAKSNNDNTSAPKEKATSDAGEVKFSLKIEGSFADYKNFLKNTETGSRLISFTTMSLSQAEGSFSAQVSGKAYYKKASTLESTLANINIPQATIDRFISLKTYGTPINLPTETGFGREDPFAAY